MFTSETEIKAHVKTDHSQTISNCNKCHETFNTQAFQEEHTIRITNVFTICDQIEPINERPCPCVHNVLQENCKQRRSEEAHDIRGTNRQHRCEVFSVVKILDN